MIDRNTYKTIEKFKGCGEAYKRYLYRSIAELKCEISEIPAPPDDPESREKFSAAAPEGGWRGISAGEKWGDDFCYAWFRTEYTASEGDEKRELLILPDTGAAESLLFINGKPSGIFDVCGGIIGNSPRLHEVQPLCRGIRAGDRFEILIEGYAGHPSPGTMPYEDFDNDNNNFYPRDTVRVFGGVKIVCCDKAVAEFIISHRLLCQLFENLPEASRAYAETVNAMCDVFAVLPQRPWETDGDFHAALNQATEIIKKITERRWSEGGRIGYIGLIGHSHLDTAWQWPVRETLHKAARTFSNALRLMEYYPDYKFIQSSVLYIDWMRKYYPDIYEGIKQRTAEGRWEPNGGAWVEFDNNIPGGEFIIRQFLRGQRYTKENLGYTADCFWEPDTFGYSAALPQILKGCGIKYFLTTKLSWNESNKFPHDTFLWRGIDGTEVLTHFNITHSYADAAALINAEKSICHKDVTDMKLLSYGFGDGGGGPSFSMQEYAERVKDMACLPEARVTTVSGFMRRLEKTAKNPPVFSGELYLELHRGTLTQMHDIKKSNRLLEKGIRQIELLEVMAGREHSGTVMEALDTLLVNQFHDILPGTCIEDAHKVAIYQNYRAADRVKAEAERLLSGEGSCMTLFNSLSWERSGQITAEDSGFVPDGCVIQRYADIDGNKKMAFSGAVLEPMSVKTLAAGKEKAAECPFSIEGERIVTPFAEVTLKDGTIISYITPDGFEAVRDGASPFNTLYCGEDIPAVWDNWDIDYDQSVKMKPVTETVSSEIVSAGALQLRIRVKKRFGAGSLLTQDIVFYSDTPRIDFETTVDWNEKHTLLKAGFDVNVLSDTARFETQFGNLKRPTHENYGTDKSQFEVCCHKWADLSDSRFGAAVLNDCKYGISVRGSDMRLTLLKGGCRPDVRGDKGRHSFTYSLLIHNSAFSAVSVIRPAYELNYPVMTAAGKTLLSELPLFTVDCDNVIIETVKNAEDKDGVIVRLYEAEGTHAAARLACRGAFGRAFETDMLEREVTELAGDGGSVTLKFRPFEIKTVKFAKP